MYTSANMGLKIWNLLADLFDYTQLQSNFAAIDTHNHSQGQGVQIPSAGIANGAVSTTQLASAAVTDVNIAALTITGDKIAEGTITSDKLSSSLTNTIIPPGVIMPFGGTAAPASFLLCDGAAISRTVNSALFAVIGSTYGAGDGSTTFNVPDLRQRFPLGKAVSGTGSTLGLTGGTIDHSHVINPLSVPNQTVPATNCAVTVPGHAHSLSQNGGAVIYASDVLNPQPQIYFDAGWPGPQMPGATMRRILFAASGAFWQSNYPDPPTDTSAGLVGTTDAAGTIGASGNTSSTVTTGSYQTTPSATGIQNPPYVVVNYIIKT